MEGALDSNVWHVTQEGPEGTQMQQAQDLRPSAELQEPGEPAPRGRTCPRR
jgi:hypothetical protein